MNLFLQFIPYSSKIFGELPRRLDRGLPDAPVSPLTEFIDYLI